MGMTNAIGGEVLLENAATGDMVARRLQEGCSRYAGEGADSLADGLVG
jgi:hypothetical protein